LNKQRTEPLLREGFSPFGQALVKFPHYDRETFPFVLVKESQFICMFNTRTFKLTKLANCKFDAPYGQTLSFIGDTLEFVTTAHGEPNLLKYVIDKALVQVLLEKHDY